MAEAADRAENLFRFDALKARFDTLWPRFGWATATRAAYPFWHLTGDDLWELRDRHGAPLRTTGGGGDSDGHIAEHVGHARFAPAVWRVSGFGLT